MKRLTRIIFTVSCAVGLCSCSKELLQGVIRSSGVIVPDVQSVSTKSSDPSTPYGELISSRVIALSDSLELTETVYENAGLPGSASTKGTVMTEANISPFKMTAYAEAQWHDNRISSGPGSPSQPYGPGEYFSTTVTGSNADGWTMTEDYYWLNGVPISFWCSKDAALSRTSATTATFEHTVASSVTGQTDPVIAYNKEFRSYHEDGEENYGEQKECESTGGSTDENVNIRFFHPMSAVQFINGNSISGTYRISGISLHGIDSHTLCTVTSDPAVSPGEGISNLAFSHASDTPASFSQSYDVDDSSLSRTGGNYDASDPKTFIMIPQTLGSNARMDVTFINANDEQTVSSFGLDGDSWEAGKYYVYKIGLAGAVKVSIAENCTDSEKSGVKFRNDSNVNEYIRAAVVANWFDASGNIVASWDRSLDGDIVPGTNWTESGGFYYYTPSVAAGAETEALIASFTKPTRVPGAHFEMTILVQAVASDGVADCQTAF